MSDLFFCRKGVAMKMYLATILGCLGVLNLVVSYMTGLSGLTYGLVDQGVLMLGAYLGWELDPWIASRFKGARSGLGVLIGALVGNTISDCLGAVTDPDMRSMVLGITNGCLVPLLFVPLIEKWKAWKEKRTRVKQSAQAFDERNDNKRSIPICCGSLGIRPYGSAQFSKTRWGNSFDDHRISQR